MGLNRGRPGRFAGVGAAAFGLTLFAGSSRPVEAQDAATIMNKVATVYANAKTYQATIAVVQSGTSPQGQAITMNATQTIAYKAPNRILFKINGRTTGIKAQSIQQTLVSDGKNNYSYLASVNKYIKGPARPKISLAQILSMMNQNTAAAKLLAPATVAGRPVFVLEVPPVIPATVPAEQRAQIKPSIISIDKSNYHVLKVTRSGSRGSLVNTFTSQSFDTSLPDSLFTFTPPKGAVQVQPQSPGGMGGK